MAIDKKTGHDPDAVAPFGKTGQANKVELVASNGDTFEADDPDGDPRHLLRVLIESLWEDPAMRRKLEEKGLTRKAKPAPASGGE